MTLPGLQGLLPSGLAKILGRMAIRETGRATIAKTRSQVEQMQLVGATVRASRPGAKDITVHIDGDSPGDAFTIPTVTWEFFGVGQRVAVLLYPPSGAVVVGPLDTPPSWIDHPLGADAWWAVDRKVPTVTELAQGSVGLGAGGTINQNVSANVDAKRLLIMCVLVMGGDSTPVATLDAIATTVGATVGWELLGSRSATGLSVSGSGNASGRVYMYRAYSHATEFRTFRLTFTGANLFSAYWSLLSIADAQEVQTAAALRLSPNYLFPFELGANRPESITTTIDHSQVISANIGFPANADGFDSLAAATGNTIVRTFREIGANEYRYGYITRSTSGATSPGATATGMAASPPIGTIVTIAVEVIGVPNVPLIGDGQLAASYNLNGRTLTFGLAMKAGSTTTYGGGPIVPRLPPGIVASQRKPIQSIGGILLPTGPTGNMYRLRSFIRAGQPAFFRTAYQDASATPLTATNPVSLGASTEMCWDGTIEIA